jgi:hypothetical protein
MAGSTRLAAIRSWAILRSGRRSRAAADRHSPERRVTLYRAGKNGIDADLDAPVQKGDVLFVTVWALADLVRRRGCSAASSLSCHDRLSLNSNILAAIRNCKQQARILPFRQSTRGQNCDELLRSRNCSQGSTSRVRRKHKGRRGEAHGDNDAGRSRGSRIRSHRRGRP